MAFTQEQKNNINLLKSDPDIFLSKLLDGNIDLKNYKDEFFRGGIGLSHIIVESVLTDFDKYKNLAKEIFTNHDFSLKDRDADNPTPIEHAIKELGLLNSHHADNTVELSKLMNLVTLAPNKINNEDFSRVLHLFFVNDDFDGFKKLFELKPKITPNEYWSSIFSNLISENQLDKIKFIVDTCENKTDITRVEWSLSYRNKGMLKEKSNLLVCAIRYSDDIANYFLDNISFPLSGKVLYNTPMNLSDGSHTNYKWVTSEENLYRTNFPSGMRHEKRLIYSATLPLNEAIELNKPELFEKILLKSQSKAIAYLLYEETITKKKPVEKSYYSYSSSSVAYEAPEKVINNILKDSKSTFYAILKEHILESTNTSNNSDKVNLIAEILSSKEINYKEKYDFAKTMIPNIGLMDTKSQNNYNSKKHLFILDGFLTQLYSNKELKSDEINLSSKILEIALKNPNRPFSNSTMYKANLYENSFLFNSFIAAGLDVSYNYEDKKNVNPFSFYYDLQSSYNSNKITNFEVANKNFNTLKELGKEFIYKPLGGNDYSGRPSLFKFALEKLDNLILNNLTDKEILKFATNEKENPTSYLPKIDDKNIETYQYITKRMFNLGFTFFQDDKPQNFYKLLNHHNDTELLTQVLKKENKTIAELSTQVEFWNFTNNPEIKDFIFKNNAKLSSLEMTLNIADFKDPDREIFKQYINNGGNINYTNENKDSLLHYLVKNELYKEATHLLKIRPELAEAVNKQEKIPLQYMIVSFNRECGAIERERNPFFKDQVEFFQEYLDSGNFSSNPKSKKMLMEQINKYTNIEDIIPHLKQIMSYKIIDASTQLDPDKKKITIRNKI